MQGSRRRLVMGILLGVVVANYVAQVVYYFHLYYPARLPVGTLALGATFVWFLAGFVLLARSVILGYWLLLTYLLAMVGFYLANMLNQMVHGFGPFFHLQERDPVLWIVFAIGYLNMLVGAYCIYVLVRHARAMIGRVSDASSGSQAA